MTTYLETHPPARSQYRRPRRSNPTGAIVVHTAEARHRQGAALAVANFISNRTDPGSYHDVVDAGDTVQVIPYSWEAFHEGTGGNRWSLGLAFACRAADWQNGPPTGWQAKALDRGAQAAAVMARWLAWENAATVPARRITPEQYRSGHAGFIGHGELDPGRRSDPGERFPWDYFLEEFAVNTNQLPEGTGMSPPSDRDIQVRLASLGHEPGPIDGKAGPLTRAGIESALDELEELRSVADTLDPDATDIDARHAVLGAKLEELLEIAGGA